MISKRLSVIALVLLSATAAGSDLDEFKVKRQPVFEFMQKPVVVRDGDKVTITFASRAYCDVSGAVYIVMSCQPLKNKVPEGIAAGSFPGSVWGTLVKFGSSFGKYPVGKVVVDKAKGTHRWGRLGPGTNVRMEGMVWDFGGVGPVPYTHCHCRKSKFDLDGFERIFLPAAPTCTVNVLDANGNIVVRLGGYGNADCMGENSPVVDPKTGELRPRRKDDPAGLKSPLAKPELGFLDPSFVAVTDEAVYVHDRGNERIVRAKLGYYVTEMVALKNVPDKSP